MSDTNERSVASAGSVAGDRDILARLRDWRSVHLARLHEVMSEAADEIERLRALADKRGTIAVNRRREIERLRLTAAEREAIEEAIKAFDEFAGDEVYVVALRTLLERTAPSRGSVANHDAVPAAIAVSDEDRTDKAATSHRRDRSGEPPCLAKGQVPLGSESVAGTNSCRRPSQTGRFSDRIRQFFCSRTSVYHVPDNTPPHRRIVATRPRNARCCVIRRTMLERTR